MIFASLSHWRGRKGERKSLWISYNSKQEDLEKLCITQAFLPFPNPSHRQYPNTPRHTLRCILICLSTCTLPMEPNPSMPVESMEQISHKHYLIRSTISVITSMFFSPITYSCSLTAGYTSNSSDFEMVVTIPHLPAPCQLHLPFLGASYHFTSPS